MKNLTKLSTIAIIALTLSSCGGGGGSSTASGGSGGGSFTANSYQKAANAVPIEGSVIQYARAKDITNIGITATGSGETTFTNVIAGQNSVVLNPVEAISSEIETGNGITYTYREYSKALPNNETLEAIITTISIGSENLSAGAWIEDYSINSVIGDVGIFVDGGTKFNKDNITALTGIRTYTGIAEGIYHSPTLDEPFFFESDNVVVTVDFGDGTTRGKIISVVITEIITNDVNVEITPGARIDLQSANIGDGEGGFTTGNATAGANDGSEYSGKWGSQFYYTDGGYPKYIAGTFGGTGTNAAAENGTFIGIFFAD